MSLGASSSKAPRGAPEALLILGLTLAGALNTLAFAPVQAWWLQPLAAVLLFVAVRQARPGQAAWRGGAFAFGWLCSGWWWLHVSLHDHGGLAWGLAALAVALLALGMSLYLALAMGLAARWRTGRPALDAALLAAAWLAAELARGQFFTGFPWSASGYAHTGGPLAALAPWVGVYGIAAVSAWASALVALALPARAAGEGGEGGGGGAGGGGPWALPRRAGGCSGAWACAAALALLVASANLGPSQFTEPAGELRASLLQPNIDQSLKFDAQRMGRNLERLIEQAHAAPGPLVVTPESVVPLPQRVLDPALWQRLREPFVQGDRAALVGIFLGDESAGYVNSMVGLSSEASPHPERFYSYGKRHLLPFGEFIPPGFGWFVALLDIPLGDQARGRSIAPFETQGQRLRPLICYEDLFAEELVDSLSGPQAATVFVNASNLAWFGLRLVQDQHLQFSRMRAMEFQRPFLRATNTGATTAIDHRGQVTARLSAGIEGRLDVQIEGRTGRTPYAVWLGRWGHAPLWLLVVLVAAAAWVRPPRRPDAAPGRPRPDR